MNDWGLPDWRDAKSYGDFRRWAEERWRWEFLRRRDDLRSAFDRNAENWYRTNAAVSQDIGDPVPVLKPNEPGFIAVCAESDCFGYTAIPNPRISEQPTAVLRYITQSRVIQYHSGENYKWLGAIEDGGKVAIIFDLNKALSGQLIEAKAALEKDQRARHGRLVRSRMHREKRISYLRVLDARELGASWSEIADLLPTTAGTPQGARDTWEQARALCFKI